MQKDQQKLAELIRGKKVAFIGAGVSHKTLIKEFVELGAHVTLCDQKKSVEEFGDYAATIRELGIDLSLGEHYLDGFKGQDIIMRTPGFVGYFEKPLQDAMAAGTMVTSEVELFFDFCPCEIVAVTGSDGKTTTTTLISKFYEAAGRKVHLGGNIGAALLPMLPEVRPEDVAVVELSSFQLISMHQSPKIAVVTNVTPNHLDHHKDMQEYIDAKRNILLYQKQPCRAVLGYENEISRSMQKDCRGKQVWFTRLHETDNGAFLRENADVKQEAVDALADWYYASSYRVPMGTAAADEAIAGWLNQNTGGLLSQETREIRTEVDNLLRLYNTIYYKSSWRDAFESSQTKQDTFTAANGAKQKTEFMHRTESGSYRKGEGYTAAPRSLNYGRMVFVLPDEGVTPESLLQRQGLLTELAGDYNAAELVWSVPKFDVKSSTGLNEALRSLGVTDAFDGTKADFTPLTDNGAAVDSVMQAARVKIDEDGVEAAAYTEIVANDSAMMETPPTVEMELDRPFLFVIFDYNNVPLFVGTVNTVA